jgi:hypothetical protein
MGLSAAAITLTRFWFDVGFGTGAAELSLRFLSRPPFPVVYCHARIVNGGDGVAIMSVIWIPILVMYCDSLFDQNGREILRPRRRVGSSLRL